MSIASSPAQDTRWRIPFLTGRSIHFVELTALAGVVAYLLLAATLIAFFPPGNDEAEYASPAVSLLEHGKFAALLYEAKGGPVPGRETIAYYMLPGHPFTSIPLIAVFGPVLLVLRLKGLIFMVAALALLFKILKLMGMPRSYAALAVALVCLNRNWMQATVLARPEPQAFFLGLAGAYLFTTRVRAQKPLGAALGGALVGFGVISHVNAVLFGIFCLAVAVYFMRKNFKNVGIYAGGLGVALAMSTYGAFIRLYPDIYRAQISWNAHVWGRVDTWSHPFAGIGRELARWAPFYRTLGGVPQQALYLAINAISLGAILVLVLRRKGPEPLRTCTAIYAIATALGFALFNNAPNGYYFFYRTFIADLSIVVLLALFSAEKATKLRISWGVAAGLVFLFHLSRDMIFARIAIQSGHDYSSLERAARANVKSDDVVMGPPELAFAYRFAPGYVVDDNLGFYSGRRPTMVAIYQNREPPPTLVDTSLGGFCVDDKAGTEQFLSIAGPVVEAQMNRDRPRLCPYFQELLRDSKVVYRDTHYELLRITAPGT